jgi:hypothetical protein
MSSTWRARQEIQAALRRAGVISERQRQAQKTALKREQERAGIQADIRQRDRGKEEEIQGEAGKGRRKC